jgi:hypothetical protein
MDWFRERERNVWDRTISPQLDEIDQDEVARRQARLRAADRHRRQTRRKLTKKVENLVRQEFGFRRVGEGWVSETELYQIVRRIFVDKEIIRHLRPDWLEGLELDIYLPSLRLAFEYQGQQHFHPIKAWGGQEALEAVRTRDARKAQLCNRQGIALVTVDYTEPLTEEYVRSLLPD